MSKGKYTNTRGIVCDTRPMSDLSLAERQQILIDLQTHPSGVVREKWNIDNTVLSHLRFYHGKSSAKRRGYYHLDLLDGVESPENDVQKLKAEGLTSGEVSKRLGIPLDKVNKLWE